MFGTWLKTSLLMAAIVALFGTVGSMLGGAQGIPMAAAEAHPATTHPDTDERIARLHAMVRV